MFKAKFVMITTLATAAILVLYSSGILQNMAFAHQRQLFTIGDKDYLFVVGSIGEPLIGIGVLVAASFLTITSPPSISLQESMTTQGLLVDNSQQDYVPSFDSFTILAIILSLAVIFGSIIYFKKSTQQVRNTVDYLEGHK